MSKPSVEEIREMFEDFMSDGGAWPQVIERSGDGYRLAIAQSAWGVWQGAFLYMATRASLTSEGKDRG